MPPSRPVARRAANVSLSDIHTLRGARDFRRVLSRGTRNREGGLVVVRSPGIPGLSRLGFVVSKRSGNAVARNRIKRRLRHAVGGVELQPGNDYVIIANKEVGQAAFTEVVRWLDRAIRASHDV